MHKRLDKDLIWEAMHSTMRLTAMVVFILIGSRVFSMVFQGVDGAKWVEDMLSGLPGGQVGFLIAVNVFIFFLAFFLDFFEIAFIILPMLGPVADKMGIDMVWFGVLLCVNMQTSFMHPPFGFALFYLRGIADTLFKADFVMDTNQEGVIWVQSIEDPSQFGVVKLNDADWQAQLLKSKTQVSLSEQKVERLKKLLEIKGISKEELDILYIIADQLLGEKKTIPIHIAEVGDH
jgi:hypothetical protein